MHPGVYDILRVLGIYPDNTDLYLSAVERRNRIYRMIWRSTMPAGSTWDMDERRVEELPRVNQQTIFDVEGVQFTVLPPATSRRTTRQRLYVLCPACNRRIEAGHYKEHFIVHKDDEWFDRLHAELDQQATTIPVRAQHRALVQYFSSKAWLQRQIPTNLERETEQILSELWSPCAYSIANITVLWDWLSERDLIGEAAKQEMLMDYDLRMNQLQAEHRMLEREQLRLRRR
jgi:hypothetical protein